MNENNFQKQYAASPQRIKDFLISEELTKTTKNIISLTKLDIDQTTQLTEMIGNVLLGQISPVNFSQEIESNLKVSPSQAKIIIELANKKIFEQFSKELEQYKPRLVKQNLLQEEKIMKIERTARPSELPKAKPVTEEKTKQTHAEQAPPEQIIPEYSFPEPSKVIVEKPVSRVEELKKVVAPKISSEQQEKIREKLLAAMQKKDNRPKIVEEMKKVSLKPPSPKETKEEKKKISTKKRLGELTSSKILSGEGKKFEDEEVFVKTEKEKPYILNVKLKEEKKKEKTPTIQEPILYKKYQKKSPFGKA